MAKRRKFLALTQDELAGRVGVDAETISRFERGASLPSIQRLFVIAESLEVGVGELLSDASNLQSDLERKIALSMRGLASRDQQLLLEFSLLLRKLSGL